MSVQDQCEAYISKQEDWKREILIELRTIIQETSTELTETLKWNVPVYKIKKDICAISAFKTHVKINFFKGAHFKDEDKLFNAGLESKNSRSIDFIKGEKIPQIKLKELIQRAIRYDQSL